MNLKKPFLIMSILNVVVLAAAVLATAYGLSDLELFTKKNRTK